MKYSVTLHDSVSRRCTLPYKGVKLTSRSQLVANCSYRILIFKSQSPRDWVDAVISSILSLLKVLLILLLSRAPPRVIVTWRTHSTSDCVFIFCMNTQAEFLLHNVIKVFGKCMKSKFNVLSTIGRYQVLWDLNWVNFLSNCIRLIYPTVDTTKAFHIVNIF